MSHSFGHESSGKGIGLIIGAAALIIGALTLAKIYGYYDIGIEEQTMYLFSAVGSVVAGAMLIFSNLKSSSHF